MPKAVSLFDKAFSKANLANTAILLVLFLLGAAGLTIFISKEHTVFPSASIDLRIPKQEVLSSADQWRKKIGYDKDKLVKSITFAYDDEAKTYLEYELGNVTANQLMRETVPIFYWNCRFRKEYDVEKLDVNLSPSGKLLGFDFDLPNDKVMPSISHGEAKAKAFAFVAEQTNWKEDQCKLVEDETIACPHRTDHSFTWEYQNLDWKGAKLRARAQVSGNLLDSFNLFLNRPEEWDRKYSTVRSNNDLLFSVAEIFFVLLYIASAFIFFDALAKKHIRWKFVLALAGFCAALFVCDQLNNLPDTLSGYEPQSSYSAFLVQTILYIFVQSPLIFVLAMIVGSAAEILYRANFANKIALEKVFTVNSLKSWHTIEALIAGTFACAICLGYQIIYYWLGGHFHYWCPLSLDNYELLTAALPSLSAFSLGFFASGQEEILYRVIMLALVQRFVGRFWLANLLQAAAWGFMHSNYPQQPAYARGIELTIEGMFSGWLLQRYGLLACFASHYLFDAVCVVLPLWSAPSLYHRISAILPLTPGFILIALGLYLRKILPASNEAELLNSSIVNPDSASAAPALKKAAQAFDYTALPNTWRYWFATAIVLVIGIVSALKPITQIYTHVAPLKVTREQAVTIAHDYLDGLHFDLHGYKVATSISNGMNHRNLEFQYIFEKAGFAKANSLAEEIELPYIWTVRYVKPLEPVEYEVHMDEKGKVVSQSITKPEFAAGANLDQKHAQQIAEDFIKQSRPLYIPFEFDDVKVQNRKKRTDYQFTFKVPKYKVDEADFIIAVDVIGDLPSDLTHYWRLPQQWRWQKEKATKIDEICLPIRIVFAALIFLAAIWWIVGLFRRHAVHWRVPLMVAGAICLLTCIKSLNYLPAFFNAYRTTTPLNTFIVVGLIGFFVAFVFAIASTTFALAVAWAGLRPDDLKERLKSMALFVWPYSQPSNFKKQRDFWLDAFLISGIYSAVIAVLSVVWSLTRFHFGHTVRMNTDYMPINSLANTIWPELELVSNLLQSLLLAPLSVALLIGFAQNFKITKLSRFLPVALIILAITFSSERYWQDYLISLSFALLLSVSAWIFLTRGIKRNPLSLLIGQWLILLLPISKALYMYGRQLFLPELATACALLLLPLLYLIYLYWRAGKHRPIS